MPLKNPYPKRFLLTHCGVCGLAITISHEAVWQCRDVTGLVHAECATDPDAKPVDLRNVSMRLGDSY